MITIIAGSRDATNMAMLEEAITISGIVITKVICGKARGADTLGELWAKAKNIPIDYYPADWETLGISAGYKRNVEMADVAEQVLLLWDGKSKVTNTDQVQPVGWD